MSEPAPRGERATRAARSTILLTPLIALVGLIGNVFVLRSLSPSDYALFATAVAIRVAIQFLVDMGTGTATSRAFAEFDVAGKRPQARTFFARLLSLRVVAVAVVAIAVALLPGLAADALGLHDNETSFLVFMVVISSCEIISGLGTPVLMGTYGQPRLNKISLVQSAVQSVLVIAAAAAGLGLDGILVALVIGSILKAALVNGFAWAAISGIHDAGHAHEPLGRQFARVATSSLIGKLSGFALSRPPMTLIAVGSVPRPQVAAFSVAYDFSHQVLLLVSSPLYSLLMPAFAGRPLKEGMALYRTCTRSLAIVTLPAGATLLATWPALIAVVFGSQYDDSLVYAALIVPVLALELPLSGPPTALMLTSDRLVSRFMTLKMAALIAAVIPLWLAHTHLIAATAAMMGLRLASALSLQLVARREGVDVQAWWLIRVTLSAAAAWAAATGVAAAIPGEIADLIAAPLTAVVTVLVLIRVARLFNSADAEVVARVVPPAQRWLARLVT
jgi:lipopolysaccharide exporter